MKSRRLKEGDHIKVRRSPYPYSHHGIYTGCNEVVRYCVEEKSKPSAVIKATTIDDFAHGSRIEIVPYDSCYTAEEVVRFAKSQIGKRGYNLVFSNCEHFATKCKTGKHRSRQVDNAKLGVEVAAAIALTAKRPRLAVGIVIVFVSIYLAAALVEQSEPSLA